MNREAPPIRFRMARSGDCAAMIEVFRGAVRLVAIRDYTREQVVAWAPDEIDIAAWAGRYCTRQGWVAEVDAGIVGFIDLAEGGLVDMLYVHPDFQRRGIATGLLRQLEMTARSRGIDRLRTEGSLTARPFFERHGFRIIAQQTVAIRGQKLVNFRMEKPLTAADSILTTD